MSLTDQFDVVVQLSQAALGRVVRAQHRAAVLRHEYARSEGDKRIELVIHAPTLTLVPGTPPLARLAAPIFYRSRPLRDPVAAGTCAVATAKVTAKLELTRGNPASTQGNSLRIDWAQTAATDITTPSSVSTALAAEVRGAILKFIRDEGRPHDYALPAVGDSGNSVGYMGFSVFSPPGAPPVLAIGMNVGNTTRGNVANLDISALHGDWSVVLSAGYIVSKIRAAISSALGGLPPPARRIAHRCTIRHFGYCANWADVDLQTLSLSLTTGRIYVTGSLKVHNSGALVPDVSATFSLPIFLSLAADGSVVASTGSADVDVSEWYAEVANFFTGGWLERAIADGINQSVAGAAGQTTFLSSGVMSGLARAGSTRSLNISPHSEYVDVTPAGVIISGSLQADDRAWPVAEFVALRVAGSSFLFHAGESWAPGGHITKYEWDFADGTHVVSAGDKACFALIHSAAGTGETCLTVYDDLGRAAKTCGGARIDTPPLDICIDNPLVNGGWDVPVQMGAFGAGITICIHAGGLVVPNATVSLSGATASVEGVSDANGRVRLAVPGELLPATGLFSIGRLRITARKDSFGEATAYVHVTNGATRQEIAAELARSIARIKKLVSLRIQQDVRSNSARVSHLQKRASDVAETADLLSAIVTLVARQSDLLPLKTLFGAIEGDQVLAMIRDWIGRTLVAAEKVAADVQMSGSLLGERPELQIADRSHH